MKIFFASDGIKIYHGDCRDVLTQLSDESVDLLLTDPPYGISYETAWRSRKDKLRKPIANDNSLAAIAEAWPSCLRVLRNDRHWYVFASPRMIAGMIPIIGNCKHTIAWDKGDRGTVGDLECGFGEAWEAILYGMKGRRPLNGKRPRTVIRHDWSSTMDPLHPTVKPVPLLRNLILMSTNTGEVVLDPFMGSGTTLRAAKDCGRQAIGIECDERYCEIAAKRMEQRILFPFE